MEPVEYMALPAAAALFAHARVYVPRAGVYAKRETTALRLPADDEIGSMIDTYKADPAHELGYSLEASSPVSADSVIARNSHAELGPGAGGAPIYNQWPLSRAMVERNYGAEVLAGLGAAFQECRKKAPVRAVELDDEALALLGARPGEPLLIKVPWSPNPMRAHRGDFLTDEGYSIAAANMKDYEPAGGGPV